MMDTPDWSDGKSILETLLLADMDEMKRALIAQVHEITSGCALLHFLDENSRAQLTADDIAFHLQEPPSQVERSLRSLVNLGLVNETEAAGIRLFGLSSDPARRQGTHDLFNWQHEWHTRLERIQNLVDGH
jgi:hypothetical protein